MKSILIIACFLAISQAIIIYPSNGNTEGLKEYKKGGEIFGGNFNARGIWHSKN